MRQVCVLHRHGIASCMMCCRSGWVRLVSVQLSSSLASLPQDPSGLGGIDLSMGRFFEPGGLADRAIGPEGQLALLADRVNVVDWHIYTYMCLNEV